MPKRAELNPNEAEIVELAGDLLYAVETAERHDSSPDNMDMFGVRIARVTEELASRAYRHSAKDRALAVAIIRTILRREKMYRAEG